jgi:probable addiction module antidote protein
MHLWSPHPCRKSATRMGYPHRRLGKKQIKTGHPAESYDDSASIAGYLTDALESDDPAFVADALGVVARARGMSEIAREAGVSRESLYRALSPVPRSQRGRQS